MIPTPRHKEKTPCRGCGRAMHWVHNVITGKKGPVDPTATVYVMLDEASTDHPDAAYGMTAKAFMENVETITMEGGKVYTREQIVGFFVSHFQTCPKANQFSGGNKR